MEVKSSLKLLALKLQREHCTQNKKLPKKNGAQALLSIW